MAFEPSQSTWDLWRDAFFPSSLSTPITATTDTGIATYTGCSGEDQIAIPVKLVLVQVNRRQQEVTDYNGTRGIVWFGLDYKFVTDGTVSDENLSIQAQVWKRDAYGTNINVEDFTAQFDTPITLLAGQTETAVQSIDPTDYNQAQFNPFILEYDDRGAANQTQIQNSISIDPNQGSIPSCATPPPACELEITGITTTDPTFKGSSDGQIVVSISGSTGGTVTYSLNGGTPQVSNTFTNLAAGTYNIQVFEGACTDSDTATLNDGEFRTSPFTVTEPSDFLASENPIVTTIRTANNAVGANAISSFTFDDGIENNYKVVFNLTSPTNYTATFWAKDFPNRDNYFLTTEISDGSGTPFGVNTTEEIADSFAEALQNDINLRRWYFISVSGSSVVMEAKQEAASLDLTLANVDVLDETGSPATTGITLTQIQAGADPYEGSLVNDYSIYTDIYVGDGNLQYGEALSGGNYNNYTSLELPFNPLNNIHQFDASEIMKTFVSTPKIDLTFTGFTLVTSMLRPFYVRYGEKYPLVANTNTKKKRSKGETGYKWILNSSLEWEEANDVSDYFTGGKFLTNAPNPLDIQRQQVNFLYFILEKDLGATLTLKGDIDYYDGTSQSGITFIDIASGSTNAGGVYALNVSYDSLGLSAYEASGNTKIKRCTFAVYSGATQFSEERTYRFEIDEQPRKFGVSFQNALGAYDTFDFVGVVENSVSRENKSYTIPRAISSDGSSQEGFKNTATFDTKVTKTLTVNSGWIDEDHFDWLIELLESNNVYSYSEPRQNYLNVTNVNYTKSSLEDLFEIEVTFTQTIYENNITV